MTDEPEYLSLGEATELLGVDRRRLRVLMERYNVPTVEDPLDFRKRLVARSEVERLAATIGKVKKAVA